MLRQLNERQRRWVAALEATRLGYGGTRAVAQITGMDEKTIRKGRREVEHEFRDLDLTRVRRVGAGRKPIEKSVPAPSGD